MDVEVCKRCNGAGKYQMHIGYEPVNVEGKLMPRRVKAWFDCVCVPFPDEEE